MTTSQALKLFGIRTPAAVAAAITPPVTCHSAFVPLAFVLALAACRAYIQTP
jgi:hypothetical protein